VVLAVMTAIAGGCRSQHAPPPAQTATTAAGSPPLDPWIDARQRGIDLRALGQEPGWYAEVEEGRSIRIVWDYGGHEAVLPAPPARVIGGATRYASATDAHHVTIVAQRRRCEDGMSGQPFPLTVTVTIDGRELRGCGRALAAERTAWRAGATSVGPIRIGMSGSQAASALDMATSPRGAAAADDCRLIPLPQVPGILVMLIGDAVARVDVIAPGVATDAGIEVGMREERVRDAYGTTLTVTAHKYVDGHYLTVASDAQHRIVFETDGGWVTRYRVGRLPEVEWVEGCA
jgi:uncharacterized membrane protein